MTALRLVAFSALCVLGAGFIAGPHRAAAADGPISFRVGDERRSAYVVERARLRRQPRPVIIVVPSAPRSSPLTRGRGPRFDEFANLGGIVVYADPPRGRIAADLDYIRSLVRVVSARRLVDPRRIHLVGYSSGGVLALQAACRDGKLFAGVAAILASLPTDAVAGCAPGKALPTMLLGGTADKLMPYGGGGATLVDFKGSVAGAEASLAPFAQAAGCSEKRTRSVQDREKSDGSRVVIEQFDGCKAIVRLVRVEGGGHIAPARISRGPRIAGENRDISTTRTVLNAFRLPGG